MKTHKPFFLVLLLFFGMLTSFTTTDHDKSVSAAAVSPVRRCGPSIRLDNISFNYITRARLVYTSNGFTVADVTDPDPNGYLSFTYSTGTYSLTLNFDPASSTFPGVIRVNNRSGITVACVPYTGPVATVTIPANACSTFTVIIDDNTYPCN